MSIPAIFLSQNVSISPANGRYNTENSIALTIPLCENYLKALGGVMAAHLKEIKKGAENLITESTLKKYMGNFFLCLVNYLE